MATKAVKAWTFTNGYPATLKQSTVHLPQDINSSQHDGSRILVKVAACALNPVDIQSMNLPKWNLPFGNNGAEKGCVCDFSGTVIAKNGSGYRKGDEIFGMTMASSASGHSGALAQEFLINLSSAVAVKKPPGWSHEQAAAISLVWLTAKTEIDAVAPWVDATSSKRVAVLGGSSATGIYTIILAKRRGWKVIATSSGRNKDFVTSSLGADAHVDYTTQDVRSGVAGFKPDAVIDCVGGTECIGLPSSKRYITIVGDKTGRSAMGGPYTYYDYFHPLTAATQWLRWMRGAVGLGESYDVVHLDLNKEWLEEAKETLRTEDIFIDSVFPFDEAKQAFERLHTGRAKGKVVVKI